MRVIDLKNTNQVSGGTSAKERMVEVCKGLPDNQKVTYTQEEAKSVGLSASRVSEVTTIRIETTCGEIRDAARSLSGKSS